METGDTKSGSIFLFILRSRDPRNFMLSLQSKADDPSYILLSLSSKFSRILGHFPHRLVPKSTDIRLKNGKRNSRWKIICIHVITTPFCIKTEYQLREHIVLIKNWEKGNWDRTICWSNLSLLIYWLSKCPSTLTREQQSLNFKGRKSTSWSMNSRIGVIQFRTTSQSGRRGKTETARYSFP